MPTLDLFKNNELNTKGKDCFIYEPWKKKGVKELRFAVNKNFKLKIILKNRFPVDIYIEQLNIQTEGIDVINYPTSGVIPANSAILEIN